MIMKKCPNCDFLTLTIPDKSDFYFTLCHVCGEKCVYLTKEKEVELKNLSYGLNKNLWVTWQERVKDENIKIKYITREMIR